MRIPRLHLSLAFPGASHESVYHISAIRAIFPVQHSQAREFPGRGLTGAPGRGILGVRGLTDNDRTVVPYAEVPVAPAQPESALA